MVPYRVVAIVCLYLTCLTPSLHPASLPGKTHGIHESYFAKRQEAGNYFIFTHSKACSPSDDGLPMYRCPTLDALGGVRCINDNSLCNHVPDCPEGEDEQPSLCLFYKVIDRDLKALFDFIVDRFETHINHRH